MEALGAAASIVAIIDLSGKLAKWSVSYLKTVKHAAAEAESLSKRLLALNDVLCTVQQNHASSHTLDSLDVWLKLCYKDLNKIETQLQPGRGGSMLSSLTWPFKQKDVLQHVENLGHWVQIFNLALTSEGLVIVQQNASSINDVHNIAQHVEKLSLSNSQLLQSIQQQQTVQIEDKKRDEILEWLFKVNYPSNHKTASRRAEAGTGKWFIEEEHFVAWLRGSPATLRLWLPGIAGAGKTVLMSTIVNHVIRYFEDNNKLRPGKTTAVVYFYFDFNERMKQNTQAMILCFIRQLVLQMKVFPRVVLELREEVPASELPDVEDALDCLQKLCQVFDGVAFLIDALDEARPTSQLVSVLDDLTSRMGNSTRFLVTSRDELYIRQALDDHSFIQVPLFAAKVDQDIARYITKRIQTDLKKRFSSFPVSLRNEVTSTLTTKAAGMFLYAHWQLNEIAKSVTVREVKDALHGLPASINDIYSKALNHIDDTGQSKWAKRALFWLCASLSEMTLVQLVDALTIDIEDPDLEVKPDEKLLDAKMILEICGSLIVLRTDETVALSHLSLRHFLSSPEAGKFGVGTEAEVHFLAARACFSFLSCGQFDEASWMFNKGLKGYKQSTIVARSIPFLHYCCCYSFEHLNQEGVTQLDGVERYLMDVLYPSFKHVQRSFEYHLAVSEERLVPPDSTQPPNYDIPFFEPPSGAIKSLAATTPSLHPQPNSSLASWLVATHNDCFAMYLFRNSIANMIDDESSWNALAWAAARNNISMLRSVGPLLGDHTTDCLDGLGIALIVSIGCRATDTALWLVAQIFTRDIRNFERDILLLAKIAMIIASRTAQENILAEIIAVASVDDSEEFGAMIDIHQICLMAAVEANHKACFTMILAYVAELKVKINPGKLRNIYEAGWTEFYMEVKLIWLERNSKDANHHCLPQDAGPTSLALGRYANVADAIVKNKNIMLSITKLPTLDVWMFVPIWYPEGRMAPEFLKHTNETLGAFDKVCPLLEELLDGESGQLATTMYVEQAVLWCASRAKYIVLLQKLLEAGANPNVLDKDGYWSPLMVAVSYEYYDTIELLLRYGADPNVITTIWPQGPVDIVLKKYGNEQLTVDILRLLFKHGLAFTDHPPDKSEPRLVKLCSQWRLLGEQIAFELLCHGANSNIVGVSGSTPLIEACGMGNKELVAVLLGFGVDVNQKATSGQYATAIVAAARSGNLDLVKMLLKAGADINVVPDSHFESWSENKADISVERYDNVLIAAVLSINQEVVAFLLDQGLDNMLNTICPSSKYGTPLIAALHSSRFYNGSLVIQELLDKGADPNKIVRPKSLHFCTAPVVALLQANWLAAKLLLSTSSSKTFDEFPAYWSAALTNVIAHRQDDLLDILLALKIPPNVTIDHVKHPVRKYGVPLIAAARKGSLDVLQNLVSSGATYNTTSVGRYGDCLTAAVASQNEEKISFLLASGHDPNVQHANRKYWSPIAAVVVKGNASILESLTNSGGLLDKYYQLGQTLFTDVFKQKALKEPEDLFETLNILRYWNDGQVSSHCPSLIFEQTYFEPMFGHPMIVAAQHENMVLLDLMIGQGIDVNLKAPIGSFRSPLIAAIDNDEIEPVRKLLAEGADASLTFQQDMYGSAAIAAAGRDDLEMFELLQELDIDIDPLQTVANCRFGSMLIAFVGSNRIADNEIQENRFLRALLEDGCKAQECVRGSHFGNAMVAAAYHLRRDYIEIIMAADPTIDINHRATEGIYGYALLAAIARESLIHSKSKYNFREEGYKSDFVKWLLNIGADPNVAFNDRTPLIAAMERVRNYDDEIVSALLDAGADPNTVVSRGRLRFDPDAYENSGKTDEYCALIAAAEHEKYEVVEMLIKHGADVRKLPVGFVRRIEDRSSTEEEKLGL